MTLKLHLIHFNVLYRQNEQNKTNLLNLIRQAAEDGADIIVTPEMALSGYSFTSRADIRPHVEQEDGDFVQAVEGLAGEFGCYVCVGLAARDRDTGAFFNSAFVAGPDGMVCRYRKINGESRWACPGEATQDNVFNTPWGRVGVLICSDSYFELLPRATVLRGADLLLIPANWPPSGLDPLELWQTRALENGIHIAACNRTGQDKSMDCRTCQSALFSPDGEVLAHTAGPQSTVMVTEIALPQGKLPNRRRRARLAARHPRHYHDIYRSLSGIKDLTCFLELPQPGKVALHCLACGPQAQSSTQITALLEEEKRPGAIWLLPDGDYDGTQCDRLAEIAAGKGLYILCSRQADLWLLFTPEGKQRTWQRSSLDDGQGIVQADIGPARLALVSGAVFAQPELAVGLSKQGCDLIVASETRLHERTRLLAGARTINHLATAVCATNGAGIWMRPEGHQRWHEELAGPGERCTFVLDTNLTRQKRFQDRVDFERLLSCQFTDN